MNLNPLFCVFLCYQMVGIFLARTLIGDIEKVKFNYYWADMTGSDWRSVYRQRYGAQEYGLKGLHSLDNISKDHILNTQLPNSFGYVTRVPSLLVYLQVHFLILLIKHALNLFVGQPLPLCMFWDHLNRAWKMYCHHDVSSGIDIEQ